MVYLLNSYHLHFLELMLRTVTMHAYLHHVGMASANRNLMDIRVSVRLDGVATNVRHELVTPFQLRLSQDQAIFYSMTQTFIKSIYKDHFILKSHKLHFSLIGNSNSINLRVRVTSSHGLLLWAGGQDSAPSADFIMIGINNGFVQVRIYLTSAKQALKS